MLANIARKLSQLSADERINFGREVVCRVEGSVFEKLRYQNKYGQYEII